MVMPKIGLTFATVLRAALRQDPDVLLVGEIRDRETAEIALRASMTGHLVLSKLHTNDAISSATRLLDIGIEGYLAAASLRGILAQRLVRKICEKCREEAAPDDQQYAWLNALVGKDRASAVAAQLREIGAIPLTIAPAKAESCPALALTWFKTTVKIDELIIFSHQMATLAKAGISIVRAVRTLRVGAQSAPCGGAGRSGGRPRRWQYLELERETVKRLKSATRYPSFVLIAIGVAIAILNVFVIPAFASVFAKFHAQLPPTRSSTGSRRPMVGMHGTG